MKLPTWLWAGIGLGIFFGAGFIGPKHEIKVPFVHTRVIRVPFKVEAPAPAPVVAQCPQPPAPPSMLITAVRTPVYLYAIPKPRRAHRMWRKQ